ncbi:hypothetical protein L1887_30356 [Cichorium endivia]|nr:hypothetical protein L1887_30356 [Cichorium endivia]
MGLEPGILLFVSSQPPPITPAAIKFHPLLVFSCLLHQPVSHLGCLFPFNNACLFLLDLEPPLTVGPKYSYLVLKTVFLTMLYLKFDFTKNGRRSSYRGSGVTFFLLLLRFLTNYSSKGDVYVIFLKTPSVVFRVSCNVIRDIPHNILSFELDSSTRFLGGSLSSSSEGGSGGLARVAVRVLDVVKVMKNDYFLADLLLLSSSYEGGVCYLETMNLDEETNLKLKCGLECTMGVDNERKLEKCTTTNES